MGKSLLTYNALLWGALILFCTYYYQEASNHKLIFGTIILSYTVMNGLIYSYLKQNGLFDNEECKESESGS